MKKSYINPVSKKQAAELKLRRKLKYEIAFEQTTNYGYTFCETCKRSNLLLDLSHIIALSRGGKTTRDNCILECREDHIIYEKKPETRPIDSIGYQKWEAQNGD